MGRPYVGMGALRHPRHRAQRQVTEPACQHVHATSRLPISRTASGPSLTALRYTVYCENIRTSSSLPTVCLPVPQGHPRIAHRFIGGFRCNNAPSPVRDDRKSPLSTITHPAPPRPERGASLRPFKQLPHIPRQSYHPTRRAQKTRNFQPATSNLPRPTTKPPHHYN
jgi:hypothetical protein